MWQAIQYRFNNTLSADSLVGEMAEARYFTFTNRLQTLLRTGQWVEDADNVYLKIVGQPPSGGRAPLIDFTLKRLRSLNPIELIRGKLNGKSFLEYDIVSSKAGSVDYTFEKLRNFIRQLDKVKMDKAWADYLDGAAGRRAISNSETITEIERRLAMSPKILEQSAKRLKPSMTLADYESLLLRMKDSTTSVGTRQSLLNAIKKPSILPTAGRLAKGSYVGAAISGVFSGVTNYQAYQSHQISGSRAIGNTVSDAVGGGGAAMAGMYIGGIVGTAIPIPVVGTVAGAAVGFVVGAGVGYVYDKVLQKPVSDAVTAVADGVSKTASAAADGISKAADAMADGAKKTFNVMGDGAKQVFGGIGSGLSKVFG
jgi:hypothetical protein